MAEKTVPKRVSTVKKRTSKKETTEPSLEHECVCRCKGDSDTMAGLAYVLGVIGASVYYITTATSFWMGVVGVLKALVWPAFLVYELMRMLGV
ncbi:MAG: hypothetical protein ACMXYM_02570 [Candidatus Woesearchaeota archaeon]